MTNNTDITATPELWRAGDRAEFTFDGVPGHSGPLRRFADKWCVGTIEVQEQGFTYRWTITDLRVTRPAPVLPEHDGAVVQWADKLRQLLTAQQVVDGVWYVIGDEFPLTSAELLERIGGAPIMVATFTPLDGSTR